MLNSINADTVNSIVSTLADAIKSLKTEIANIDEKYKKLLEEAKSSLSDALTEAENQYNYWLVVRGDLPAPEKKTRTRRSKKVEESVETPVAEIVEADVTEPETYETEAVREEKIVDTLFEENNTIEEEKQPVVEETSTVEEEAVSEEWNEEASSTTAESDEIWPEETEEEKEPVMVDAVEDNEWPAFPEEWK